MSHFSSNITIVHIFNKHTIILKEFLLNLHCYVSNAMTRWTIIEEHSILLNEILWTPIYIIKFGVYSFRLYICVWWLLLHLLVLSLHFAQRKMSLSHFIKKSHYRKSYRLKSEFILDLNSVYFWLNKWIVTLVFFYKNKFILM